jgi:AcrR family transcriptional regulator
VPRSYHHGNLRQALLDAALAVVRERRTAATLTLREVAQRAGVSHNAPYRHFADLGELVRTIAHDGFAELEATMLERAKAFEDPRERLRQFGLAYVEYAQAHTAAFRVMFDATFVDGRNAPSTGPLDLVLEEIDRGRAAGVLRPGKREHQALSLWSAAHGLAQLVIDGAAARNKLAGAALVAAVIDSALAGLTRAGATSR